MRDRTGTVLTTQYHAKIRIASCQFLRKVGNSGILCETRREVLPARERTLVRDRTGMVLTTQYHAKLRIAGLVGVFGNIGVVRLSVSRIIAGLSAVGTLLSLSLLGCCLVDLLGNLIELSGKLFLAGLD